MAPGRRQPGPFDGGSRNKAYLRLFTNIPFKVGGLNAYFSTPISIRKADKGGHDLYMEPESFVSFGPKDAYAVGIRLEHHQVGAPNIINSDGDRSKTTANVAFKWAW